MTIEHFFEKRYLEAFDVNSLTDEDLTDEDREVKKLVESDEFLKLNELEKRKTLERYEK